MKPHTRPRIAALGTAGKKKMERVKPRPTKARFSTTASGIAANVTRSVVATA